METPAIRGLRVIGAAVPNNLPRYLTSFVGRSTELSALKSMLARSRIVTLTGPGGAGKSRLAAELGRACLNRWPDGVWWVELAAVNDPRQVASTVLAALGLVGHGPARDLVVAWLCDRRTLLVLDNCEHLVAACADFCGEVLQGCPEVTLMTTSREPLGLPGEARWPLSALVAPDAIALFEARARLALPNFRVGVSNREPVSEICERLDRLPLAIELAAARVGVMAEKEILSQLRDRFRLLSGGSRMDPERQRTLSATIDWSYRLLTGDEAKLFRCLSVFRGGFTLESAEAVCSNGAQAGVLDQLAGLVQKSMVVAERIDGSTSRYRLLESQLAYGEGRLRETTTELERIRRRHYEYFREGLSAKTTTEHTGRRLRAGSRPGFIEAQWIARESGNLWAAMRWARNNADDLGLGLAADLAILRMGDLPQLRSLLEELLQRSRASGRTRVHALGSASHLAYKQGDYEAALVHADAGVALARDMGDDEEVAQALHAAGAAHLNRGELDLAAENLEEASFLLKDSSNYRLVNFIRNATAHLAIRRGDYAVARTITDECLITSRADGDVSSTAFYLDALAAAQRGLNEFQAAAVSSKEALSIQRGMGNQFGIIDALEGLSIVAESCGDDRRALRLAAVTTRLTGDMSYGADTWWSGQRENSRQRSRARLGTRASEMAWKQGWAMTLDRAADYALSESETEVGVEAGSLSRREREVARLVAAGFTNRQIGERLFISGRTAAGHVERIRAKLGVRSRTEVATWAVERGLTPGQTATEPGPR